MYLVDVSQELMELGSGASEDHEDVIKKPLVEHQRVDSVTMFGSKLADKLVNDSHEDISIVGGTPGPHGGAPQLLIQLFIELEDIPFEKEVQELSMHPHANFVQMLGASVDGPNLCLVMKYMKGGSVRAQLARQPPFG